MCQLIEIPSDEQYHIIGTKPAIDNDIVAHHIIVYGCDELGECTVKHFLNGKCGRTLRCPPEWKQNSPPKKKIVLKKLIELSHC